MTDTIIHYIDGTVRTFTASIEGEIVEGVNDTVLYVSDVRGIDDYDPSDMPVDETIVAVEFGEAFYIDDGMFGNCVNLSSVTFRNNSDIHWIGSYVFAGCTSLKDFAFSSGVLAIQENVFDGSGISAITFPDNVVHCDWWEDYSSYPPDTMMFINSFQGCSELKQLVFPNYTRIEYLNKGFERCDSLSCLDMSKTDYTYDNVAKRAIRLSGEITEQSYAAAVFDQFGLDTDRFNSIATLNGINYPVERVRIEFTDGSVEYSDLAVNCYSANCYVTIDTFYFDGNVYNPSEKTDRIKKITFPYLCQGLSGESKDSLFRYMRNLTDLHFSPDMTLPDTVWLEKSDYKFGNQYEQVSALTLPENAYSIPDHIFYDTVIESIKIPQYVKNIPEIDAYSYRHQKSFLTSIYGGENVANGFHIRSGISSLDNIPDFKTTTLAKCTFNGCSNLRDISRLFPLEHINEEMFRNTAISSIEFGSNLSCIPDDAFGNCTNIRHIEFNQNLLSIGWSAFENCTELSSISLNNGLKSIDRAAFANTKIKSVVVPDTVINFGYTESTSLGEEGPFAYCKELTGIYLPNSIQHNTPLRDVFYNCENLVSVVYPSAWTNLAESMYNGCTNLPISAMILPTDGIEYIPYNCYNGCRNLTSIEFPSSVNEIYQAAFSNTGLTHVNLSSIRHVYSCFNNCHSLSSAIVGDSIMLTPFAECSALTDVSCIGSYVPDTVCDQVSSLRRVYFNPDIIQIKSQAFRGCSGLSAVEFPQSLSSIGTAAFQNSGLEHLELPVSLVTVGDNAFSGSKVKDAVSENLTAIPANALSGCRDLTSVSFGSAVSIGDGAFTDCSSLQNVDIPLASSIGNRAFRNDISVSSPVFSQDITCIGILAFENCISLTGCSSRSGINVGKCAFSGCTSLKSFSALSCTYQDQYIGVSNSYSYYYSYYYDNTVAPGMFANCSALTDFNVSVTLTSILGYSFENCQNLVSVNMCPDYIGEKAFYNCISLMQPDLQNCTGIYDEAFMFCNGIRYVFAPKLNYMIGDRAFAACDNLEYAFIGGNIYINEYDIPQSSDGGHGAFAATPLKTLDVTRTEIQPKYKSYICSMFSVDHNTTIYSRSAVKPNIRFNIYSDTSRWINVDLTKIIGNFEYADIRINGRKTILNDYDYEQLQSLTLKFDRFENECEIVYKKYDDIHDICDIQDYISAFGIDGEMVRLDSINLQNSHYSEIRGACNMGSSTGYFKVTLNNGIRIADEAFMHSYVNISRLDMASYIGDRAFYDAKLYSPIVKINCPVGIEAFQMSNVQYASFNTSPWLGIGVKFRGNKINYNKTALDYIISNSAFDGPISDTCTINVASELICSGFNPIRIPISYDTSTKMKIEFDYPDGHFVSNILDFNGCQLGYESINEKLFLTFGVERTNQENIYEQYIRTSGNEFYIFPDTQRFDKNSRIVFKKLTLSKSGTILHEIVPAILITEHNIITAAIIYDITTNKYYIIDDNWDISTNTNGKISISGNNGIYTSVYDSNIQLLKTGGTFVNSRLKSIKRLDTVSSDIPPACFLNTNITEAKIPGTALCAMAFSGCKKISSLKFCGKQDETTIGEYAFYNALSNVNIYDTRLDTVRKIGDSAFLSAGITGDIKVYPHQLSGSAKQFMYCEDLTRVKILSDDISGTRTIPYMCFTECTAISSIQDSDRVDRYDAYCFDSANLVSVYIADGTSVDASFKHDTPMYVTSESQYNILTRAGYQNVNYI